LIVDITNEVLTNLKTTLEDVTVLTAYPSTTPKFPCVIVEEMSNNSYELSIDSAGQHHNEVSFEINIFSNARNKMTQVKSIRNLVDAIMADEYRMTRDFSGATPNFLDNDIYRYTMRYSCVLDNDKVIYRR